MLTAHTPSDDELGVAQLAHPQLALLVPDLLELLLVLL